MSKPLLGMVCAMLAAFVNGTVGIFAKSAGASGMQPATTAFFKCFIAMLLTGAILAWRRELFAVLKGLLNSPWLAAAGFSGVFVMNTFEIRAYEVQSVATTVLMFLVGSAVTTQVLARVVFAEKASFGRWMSLAFSLMGAYLIFRGEIEYAGIWGCALGMIAGAGYGGYLVIAQKARIASSVATIFQVTLWGSLFLLPGYALSGLQAPSLDGVWALVGLAVVPTILGYYFTTLAVSYVEASRVQLYELSEPLFAVVLAALVLGEAVSGPQMVGGAFIISSIFVGDRLDRWFTNMAAGKERACDN
jgi:drug/metabolite transporter (DMT)-like permease